MTNTVVVEPGKLDRSPTGTGVSARMALLHAQGVMGVGDRLRMQSVIGSEFVGEIAAEGAMALPGPPGTVRLEALSDADANTLFRVVAANVLVEQGYDVVLPRTSPEEPLPAADSVFRYDVLSIDLVCPEVGRTLGLWKRWVSRSVEVTCTVEVVDDASGQLLMSNRITRGFHDRLDQDFFDDVNSDVYDFTSSETSESGWKRRTEELVVLGTLVGLIAVKLGMHAAGGIPAR